MIGAILITFFPTWNRIDPCLTFIFGIIVMMTTIPITRDCVRILMEGAPAGFKTDRVESEIKHLHGVKKVNDLHVW